MLRMTEEFANAEILRSRNPEELDTADILVDVGAEYDPETYKFDHHQRGFSETFSEKYDIKLSSAGLVYKHFGKETIKSLKPDIDDELLDTIFDKLYSNFIKTIDAIDNGINQYDTEIEPKYKITTDLSARVGKLNPAWNDDSKDIMEQFNLAVELTGTEYVQEINFYLNTWLPARDIVQTAIENRFEHDEKGRIIVLPQHCPWKQHFYNLEDPETEPILYCLFLGSGSWRVQCVSVMSGSFENRLSLPEPWQGKRNEELSEAAGIEGCIFVHANGFIGGTKTFEGAMAMAKKAIAFSEMDQE
eukprot:TRINITY_DN1054_c0_g1_i4.p1 TRINITY_DN1054_c0_g1~~TRINITY_DN1054_c0_g1_i4.p1  ORF type:complete len:303 (-),score=88.83 TRINITY_DN1054_c0_g1_i4:25-933(-)